MNDKRWTVAGLARSAAEVLEKRGFEQARLEADLLLAEVLGIERLELYTRFDMPVDDDQRAGFRALVKRRLTHEPVAYILGRKDFLDLTFKVGPGVLIPRPETEHVVDAGAVFLEQVDSPRIIEVGCGSGCIVLSLLHRFPQAEAVALDISQAALGVTRANAAGLGLDSRLDCRSSDLLSAVSDVEDGSIDLLISNPPYIKKSEAEALAPDVRDHEPEEALFCPEDGLAFHRQIIEAGRRLLKPNGSIVLELGTGTGAQLSTWAAEHAPGWAAAVLPDYAGHDRVFCLTKARWPEGFSGLHGASVTS